MVELRDARKVNRPAQDDGDGAVRAGPVTEKPKPTRMEAALQHKREKAGLGIMQLVAFGAGLLGRLKIAPVLPEDVAAIAMHAPPIAKGMADCAAEDERFARVFDKITAMGPYGALIEAVLPLVAQVAANHNQGVRSGKVDPAQFGAMHPDQLVAMVTGNGAPPEAP